MDDELIPSILRDLEDSKGLSQNKACDIADRLLRDLVELTRAVLAQALLRNDAVDVCLDDDRGAVLSAYLTYLYFVAVNIFQSDQLCASYAIQRVQRIHYRL